MGARAYSSPPLRIRPVVHLGAFVTRNWPGPWRGHQRGNYLTGVRIVYVDIDSCRPDHLGCYGYERPTSPHIDAVAAEGMVFHKCYASDAPCMPSRTAFYSGRFGVQSGVVGHGGSAATPRSEGAERGFRDALGEQGLAAQMQKLGLHTAMISPFGQRHAAHWIYAGFNEVHNTGGMGEESADQIWPTLTRWLEHNSSRENWFLHVNLWDPHTPYRTPADHGDPFAQHELPVWLRNPDVLARHLKKTGPHSARDVSMYDDAERNGFPRQPGAVTNAEELRRLIDGYDTGVHFADLYVGKMVAQLKAMGIYDETAIIISADHGENLGELGIYAEHATADEATCHIPLIVRWPGGERGNHAGLCYGLDLAPTMIDLLGAKSPALWDGRSLAGIVMQGRTQPERRADLVFGQGAHVCQRSVRWDRWLYIRTYHDGFHLFPSEMLFDLVSDPHEQHDLAESRPEVVREAAWRLMRWHDAQMQQLAARSDTPVDPLWTVVAEGGPFHARLRSPGRPGGAAGLRRYLERLETTDRTEGAAVLRKRYAVLLNTA